MSVATPQKKGQWGEAEHKAYLNCVATHGADFRIMQASIPTRSKIQIQTHHYHHIKMLNMTTAEFVSSLKKRKSAGESIMNTPKRAKSTPSKTAIPSLMSPSKARPSTATKPKRSTPVKAPSKPVRKLPLNGGRPVNNRGQQGSSKKPSKLEPTTAGAANVAVKEDIRKGWFSSFIVREEVQTILAGLFGFVLVVSVKKVLL